MDEGTTPKFLHEGEPLTFPDRPCQTSTAEEASVRKPACVTFIPCTQGSSMWAANILRDDMTEKPTCTHALLSLSRCSYDHERQLPRMSLMDRDAPAKNRIAPKGQGPFYRSSTTTARPARRRRFRSASRCSSAQAPDAHTDASGSESA